MITGRSQWPHGRVMKHLCLVAATVVFTCGTPASAHAQEINRTASGQPNMDIRVGVYVNVKPDCTSGPLPAIRLTSPPHNGKVTVKQAKVTATNYKQCLALEVPGFVAFYRSRADFAGVDVLTLEVKFAGGRMELQRISVTVGTGAPGQGI